MNRWIWRSGSAMRSWPPSWFPASRRFTRSTRGNCAPRRLAQLSHLCKTPEQRAEIAQAALDLVGKAEADKREDAALDLATLAANLSQTANNAGLRNQARDARERIRRTQKLADDVKIAQKPWPIRPAIQRRILSSGCTFAWSRRIGATVCPISPRRTIRS